MAQTTKNFTVMNQTEDEIFEIDFSLDIPAGAAIASITSVTLVVASGTDPDPNSRLNGAPQLSGTKIRQRITNPLAPVIYKLVALVQLTPVGVLELWSYLPTQLG